MGLISIIKKVKAKEKEMRLLMVGLDNAGKTTIVKRINGEDISTISPTLGFSIKTMQYKAYRLNIWDVGGQKTLRSYWRNYYEQTDGLVWVVDSSDTRRLADCAAELAKLLQVTLQDSRAYPVHQASCALILGQGLRREEKLAGATLLVFANKQDLPGSLTCEEIRDVMALDKLAGRHWKIVPCSAVTGEGLLEGFDWIVGDIGSRIYLLE